MKRLPDMDDRAVKLLSHLHTGLYRLTGGLVGRRLVHNDMMLLTTTGRSSGRPHTVPLLYLRDGDRFVVIASYGGRPDHPEWYRNLLAEPRAMAQVLASRFEVDAETMDAASRAEWWPRVVDAYSDYAVYQSRTTREIPVLRLTPVTDS